MQCKYCGETLSEPPFCCEEAIEDWHQYTLTGAEIPLAIPAENFIINTNDCVFDDFIWQEQYPIAIRERSVAANTSVSNSENEGATPSALARRNIPSDDFMYGVVLGIWAGVTLALSFILVLMLCN